MLNYSSRIISSLYFNNLNFKTRLNDEHIDTLREKSSKLIL